MNSRPAVPTVRHLLQVLMLACVLALNGCALFAPPRPFATEAEALAVRGEPNRRWPNGDGTTTLEYATQPNGNTCLMVQVDDVSGIVVRQWDALELDNLVRVQKGMSTEEVSRLLGEHRSEQFFKLSGELVWDWNIYNNGPGIATLFNVHFIDGRVVRTSQSYIYLRDQGFYGPWGAEPFGFYRGYPYVYPRYPRYPHPRYDDRRLRRHPPVPFFSPWPRW